MLGYQQHVVDACEQRVMPHHCRDSRRTSPLHTVPKLPTLLDPILDVVLKKSIPSSKNNVNRQPFLRFWVSHIDSNITIVYLLFCQ